MNASVYYAGWDAYLNGVSLNDNPFRHWRGLNGTPGDHSWAHDWNAGWQMAESIYHQKNLLPSGS